MPIVDLSNVTDALRTLIAEGIAASVAWFPNPAPDVEPIPPDAMTGEGLTLHLYGLGENATAANRQGRTSELPLGLDLHYQLVAHGGGGAPTASTIRREQLLLGLAMRVLHDVPRIEAGVSVNGVDILGASGIPAGNTMSITLRKLEPEQAITWWTASSVGPRAAAYYTVSVALVQEEPTPVSGPPVLVREVFGFAGTAPHLVSSAATHQIARPGSAPVPVRSSPAQVPPGGTFDVLGHGFRPDVGVRVRAESWDDYGELGGATVRTSDGIEILTTGLDTQVEGRLVVPGVMRVRAVRREERLLADGTTKEFTFDSNDTVLTVVPDVAAVAPGAPFTIDGGPFEGPGIDPADVRLTVGPDELTLAGAAPAAGEFRIVDRSTIEFVPASLPASGTAERLRLLVNGAECLPTWFVAP